MNTKFVATAKVPSQKPVIVIRAQQLKSTEGYNATGKRNYSEDFR